MNTTLRKTSLNLTDDIVAALDEIRVLMREDDIPSRSEVARFLIERGIASLFAGTIHDPEVSDVGVESIGIDRLYPNGTAH